MRLACLGSWFLASVAQCVSEDVCLSLEQSSPVVSSSSSSNDPRQDGEWRCP